MFKGRSGLEKEEDFGRGDKNLTKSPGARLPQPPLSDMSLYACRIQFWVVMFASNPWDTTGKSKILVIFKMLFDLQFSNVAGFNSGFHFCIQPPGVPLEVMG